MNSIEAVSVSKIFDVNSTDAVEVEIVTTSGYGRCSYPAPSDAVKKAREQVSALIGLEVNQQAEIDELLQEIFSLSNMSMAFSVAVANAAAASLGMPLYRYLGGLSANSMPYPLMKIVSAEVDYFAVPTGAGSFASAIAASIRAYREFSKSKMPKGPIQADILSRLTMITEGISRRFGFDVKLGVDFKASRQAQNALSLNERGQISASDRLEHILTLVHQYGLYFIEDPFNEAEYEFQTQLADELHAKCLIASAQNLDNAIPGSHTISNEGGANLAFIVPTKTVSSVFENYAYETAKGHCGAVLTDNSTTCEASTSHVAVALSAPFIKLSVKGRQSTAKTNELIRIEQELFDGRKYRMATKPI
jgi:enolase 1/2/3